MGQEWLALDLFCDLLCKTTSLLYQKLSKLVTRKEDRLVSSASPRDGRELREESAELTGVSGLPWEANSYSQPFRRIM